MESVPTVTAGTGMLSVYDQQAGRFAASVDKPEGEFDEFQLVSRAIPEVAALLLVALGLCSGSKRKHSRWNQNS
jgi:hypothetical protein